MPDLTVELAVGRVQADGGAVDHGDTTGRHATECLVRHPNGEIGLAIAIEVGAQRVTGYFRSFGLV
jgi:hypothetical protein